MIPYEDYKVYGPYLRKDGRMHMCFVHKTNKSKKTVSYPKYVMEIKLGKYLESNETVHHIDGDISNNLESNFEVVNLASHLKYHKMKVNTRFQPEIWNCSYCKKDFTATSEMVRTRYYNEQRDKCKSGKFCSKQCNGKVNH